MKPYIGPVYQDPGSAYGITFPDALGCFSAADRLDALFGMAEEAVGLWLEGMAEDQTIIPAVRERLSVSASLCSKATPVTPRSLASRSRRCRDGY